MYTRLTTTKLNRIFLCFSEDITAAATAKITGINRNTVNRYFGIIREKILKYSIFEQTREISDNVRHISYFKKAKIRRKKIRDFIAERPVLGLLKNGKKIFVSLVHDDSHESLFSIIKGDLEKLVSHQNKIEPFNTSLLKDCDQYRVFYDESEIKSEHTAGIENFLTFAKKRLAKFNGFSSGSFLLHLKECEFRYNHRDEDLCALIKKIFKKF